MVDNSGEVKAKGFLVLLNKEADRTFLLSTPYTVNRNSDVNLIGYLVLLNNIKKEIQTFSNHLSIQ